MNRNEIVWILECCLLFLDNVSKKEMNDFGASDEEIEIGTKLYSYLKNKKIVVEVKNGTNGYS